MQLIIVESPTKAKTIKKFLPAEYNVKSSFGHIRDLPEKKIGIDIENNFSPEYVIPAKAQKHVDEIKSLAAKADGIILATDEDREGEAIAWHLISAADIHNRPTSRIVFHEITKPAILEALKHPRSIDMNLVNAQQARRILDRLVGYKLSPLLWKKIRMGLSAGRVQSVAVRLIVEREREIRAFKPQEYWSIEAQLHQRDSTLVFGAKLIKIGDKKIDKLEIQNQQEAETILSKLKDAKYEVVDIQRKQVKKSPYPPFTTSSLQQEASSKLGFSPKQTMMFAQKLYEEGYITYMRTDSYNLSAEAVAQARTIIEKQFGKKYLPDAPHYYKTRKKGAQEAHEAIRPTNLEITEQHLEKMDEKAVKLYTLIWQKMLACQMNPAIFESTAADIQAHDMMLRANGSVLIFDGYQRIYTTQSKETLLPELHLKEELLCKEIKNEQHFTEPPARYSEATLVKALEEKGIGRPSTYAPTISTIQTRSYVTKNDEKRLQPTDIGELVNDVLVEHFQNIVDYEFTAHMEADLDDVAEGNKNWVKILQDFYTPFAENLALKNKTLSKKEITESASDQICEKCGKPMVIKMGRFGKFLACSNYPECKNTKPIPGQGDEAAEVTSEICEKCGKPMAIKRGRFGKFLGCSGYPDCKNIKRIEKKIGMTCPKCKQGEVVEKKTKRGKIFFGCNRYPDCEFSTWQRPTGALCATCGSAMIEFGKNKKEICSNKECPTRPAKTIKSKKVAE